MTCPHTWFLKDFKSNSERVSVRVGDDWRVKCGHCGESIAGSVSFKSKPIITLRWTMTRAWFGELEEMA